ncbi:hypothetical protein FKM82_026155 [Ascaphus truei]
MWLTRSSEIKRKNKREEKKYSYSTISLLTRPKLIFPSQYLPNKAMNLNPLDNYLMNVLREDAHIWVLYVQYFALLAYGRHKNFPTAQPYYQY